MRIAVDIDSTLHHYWDQLSAVAKRRYGTRRSRLKGQQGARTSVGWSVLTYNLDTLAIRNA